MSNSTKKYKRMAVAALAAALIFLVVAFLQIPFPIGQGGHLPFFIPLSRNRFR